MLAEGYGLEDRRLGMEDVGVAAPEQGCASAEDRLTRLLTEQPSLRHILYAMLELCSVARSSAEIDAAVVGRMPGTSVYEPAVLREWLVRAGGLVQVHLERDAQDGQDAAASDSSAPLGPGVVREEAVQDVTSGSPVDSDSSDSEDASLWQTSAPGLAVVEAMAPSALFQALLRGPDASYADIFAMVLEFCREVPRSKNEIEDLIGDLPELQNPRRYASYFINRLGEVGAIEWNSGWSTTATGRISLEH